MQLPGWMLRIESSLYCVHPEYVSSLHCSVTARSFPFQRVKFRRSAWVAALPSPTSKTFLLLSLRPFTSLRCYQPSFPKRKPGKKWNKSPSNASFLLHTFYHCLHRSQREKITRTVCSMYGKSLVPFVLRSCLCSSYCGSTSSASVVTLAQNNPEKLLSS